MKWPTFKHKVAKKDFEESMLPSNRIDLFFDFLKNHYSDLIKIGMFLLLFLLPFLGIIILQDVLLVNVQNMYASAEIDLETLQSKQTTISFYSGVFEIPCLMIFAIGLSGVCNVMKEYSYQQPVFFGVDFKAGIKKNWVAFMLTGLVAGIIAFISRWLMLLFKQMPIVAYGQIGISFILFVPIIVIFLSSINMYEGNKMENLRNSCELFGKTFPTTIVAIIAIFAPILFLLIPQIIVKYAMLLIYIIVILPVALFGWVLYSNFIFDKFVNAYYHPEMVDKGLYKKKK